MPQLDYDTDDLRTGGRHADEAAQAAHRAAVALGSAGGASPFGRVFGAAALHGAVGVARGHHARAAAGSAHGLTSSAGRARTTAELGDENTAETTRVAPRPDRAAGITAGM